MSSKIGVFVFGVIVALCALLPNISCDNQARYDNYRLYRIHLQTKEHVALFQELEERSDSYTFYGHARQPNQNLTILVASQKIAEITEILTRYKVQSNILVSLLIHW